MMNELAIVDTNNAIRPTTVIQSRKLSEFVGANVTIVSETFQHTGSFKFRAAYNLALKVKEKIIIAASSGNFGQALAASCKMFGKECIVVMPSDSSLVKIEAVRQYGGKVDLVDVRVKSRIQRVEELAAEFPDARVVSAFDDPLIIEGNSTLGTEIAGLHESFDYVVAPIGGGGLSSGIVVGMRKAGCTSKIIGAEPALANDAALSLRAGYVIKNVTEPPTIADGARTLSVGQHNWQILKEGLADVVEVDESKIEEAVRALFSLVNLKSEPTGALSIGALLTRPELFHGSSVCCVVSGGNVDPELYIRIIKGTRAT